jgi:hypothetical protein
MVSHTPQAIKLHGVTHTHTYTPQAIKVHGVTQQKPLKRMPHNRLLTVYGVT